MRILLTLICLSSFSLLLAQQKDSVILKGNEAYNQGNYVEAAENYQKGLDNNESFEGHFNLGNALYRQGEFQKAMEEFQVAEKLIQVGNKTDKEEKESRLAATYHNIGNSLYAQQEYGKAADAYKNSLRLNPKDDEARYNYVKARKKNQQQQNQQNQQNQNNKQQNQNNQNNQQEQDKKLDKETAEQLLQALEQDEKETQEKRQTQQGAGRRRLEKEW